MLRRLGLGAKLVLATVALTLVAGLLIERLGRSELDRAMVLRMQKELASELALLEDDAQIEAARTTPTTATWSALAHRFGEHAGVRATLIATNGAVVGDSEVALDALAGLENHAKREEVREALELGTASVIRMSPTLGVRMLYSARRYPAPEQGLSVIRLAVPLTEVDAAIASSERVLLLGILVAVVLALAVNALGTLWLTRPVRELKDVALSMARGDLNERAVVRGADEVAALGEALNRLAGELSSSMDELRADRDLLSGILDGMNEGVLVQNEEGKMVLANRALRRMTAMSADATGRPVIEAIRSAGLQQALDEAQASDRTLLREIEIGGLMTKRVLVRVSPLSGSPHSKRGVIAVLHDVTDLRRLETIRTDFVANVSHELRTPITAIATSVETLLQGALSDPKEALEFVEVIERHSHRLRHLVDDLLDLSKIESKGFRLNLAEHDLVPIVNDAVELVREPAERRHAKLSLKCEAGVPRARVDKKAVEQILLNLLDNAIKYAGEGAHVSVSLEPDGDHVLLAVSDDGPGIPASHVDRIFERFYRIDPGRSRDLGGTGLGLSIVKHLVELSNGSIQVESGPGRGASFRVRLPRAA